MRFFATNQYKQSLRIQMKTYKNKNENYIIQQYKWKSSNIDMKLYKNKNKWNVYNANKILC